MISNKMFIPKTITVGYNKREDTYTGKLAYIIYTDDKGKLRKEASWDSWRDKSLGDDNFNNEPTSGFVLNKGVGGVRMSYGHNARNEYVRVYDPRNFEFEISISNLLFILQECSSIKGKGLEGEFVYCWRGTELVLLPTGCEEYRECVKHTERQSMKFDKKDMKEGHSYLMKDGKSVLYLGRMPYNNCSYFNKNFAPDGKKHIFVNLSEDSSYYIVQTGYTKIAECTSSDPLPQFPDEFDKFKSSAYCGDYKKSKIKKVNFNYYDNNYLDKSFLMKKDDKYYLVFIRYDYGTFPYGFYGPNIRRNYLLRLSVVNKSIDINNINDIKSAKKALAESGNSVYSMTEREFKNIELYNLYVITERGKELMV